jgi:hypothetical protein
MTLGQGPHHRPFSDIKTVTFDVGNTLKRPVPGPRVLCNN